MSNAGRPDPHTWIRAVLAEYERPLLRYAARITANVDLARDVVQDTFVQFCSNGAPRDETRVAQWLYTVCRNKALDIRRKVKPMRPLTAVDNETYPDAAPPPSEQVERLDTADAAVRHLEALPPNQQEAIRLRLQGGLSYREISEVMNTSIGNVGYLLHHGINTIRERLNAADPQARKIRRTPR